MFGCLSVASDFAVSQFLFCQTLHLIGIAASGCVGVSLNFRRLATVCPQAFQRLIYVSGLVFSDQKASVLLPWRENFNLNDAQLFTARRDNAKAVFKAHLDRKGADLPADRCMRTMPVEGGN